MSTSNATIICSSHYASPRSPINRKPDWQTIASTLGNVMKEFLRETTMKSKGCGKQLTEKLPEST